MALKLGASSNDGRRGERGFTMIQMVVAMAIIFANVAILGGIALWRLAVRWVIPRFA